MNGNSRFIWIIFTILAVVWMGLLFAGSILTVMACAAYGVGAVTGAGLGFYFLMLFALVAGAAWWSER